MKLITHLVTSVSFAFLISKFIPLSIAGLILVGISSLIPDYFDILTKGKHRGTISHNLLVPLSLSILIYDSFLAGLVIGYAHHLMIDMLTKQGIFFAKEKIRGFLYSKNIGHNVLVILLHYAALLLTLI